MEKENKSSSFYANNYGERRRKRHKKGQTRMTVLIVILVVLAIIWLILPNPSAADDVSDPADRTRTFPTEEGAPGSSPDDATYGAGETALPPEDIAPNPLLEAYIDKELRESPYHFEITYPNKEAKLVEQSDGTHLFRVAGRLYAAEEDEDEELSKTFRVHFFSNKPEDYEAFQPIFTDDLSFQVEGDHYVFQLSHPAQLDPGLYYYLIEETEGREVFTVGKVSVPAK